VRSKPQTESAKLLRRMYTTLLHAYGPQLWWPAQTPFEVIVGAFLTQSTSWRAVEKSIENLRRQGILNIEGLRAISEAELRDLIKPTGFMHRKASSLKAFIHFLDHEYDGSLARFSEQDTPKARKQLLDLPGVGPETADAILLYALGHPVMVVDEYLRRLVTRHQLAHENVSYQQMQELALQAFFEDAPPLRTQHYNEFHALVVELGKRHCKRSPQCDGCPLSRPIFHPPRFPSDKSRQNEKEATRK